VKLDTDANPGLARTYQIQTIQAVKAGITAQGHSPPHCAFDI